MNIADKNYGVTSIGIHDVFGAFDTDKPRTLLASVQERIQNLEQIPWRQIY